MRITRRQLRKIIYEALQSESYDWRDKARRHRDEYELERNPQRNRWSVRLPEPGSVSLDDPGHEEEAGWGDVEDAFLVAFAHIFFTTVFEYAKI